MAETDAITKSGTTPKSRDAAAAMLARSVAHDINNLMSSVLGNTAVIREALAGQPELLNRLSQIETATDKTAHLAARLLAFIEGTKRPPQVINLNHVVASALHIEEQELAPRVRVKRYLDPDLRNVAADSNAVNQIILTTSINAIRSIGDGEGRITLSTQNIEVDEITGRALHNLAPGPYVLFTVEDTGGGLSEEEKAGLFEASGGALASAYVAVKDHQGYIAIRNEPGIGTAYDIYLPATDAALGKTAVLEGENKRGHETILVVDDEELILDVTRSVLESLGYEVLTANSGEEALTIADTYDGVIHACLMDMAMPGMGGGETFPQLMKRRPDVKVVIMSGFDLGPLGRSLEESGVSGILQKPFRSTHLTQAVREALDEPAVAH